MVSAGVVVHSITVTVQFPACSRPLEGGVGALQGTAAHGPLSNMTSGVHSLYAPLTHHTLISDPLATDLQTGHQTFE